MRGAAPRAATAVKRSKRNRVSKLRPIFGKPPQSRLKNKPTTTTNNINDDAAVTTAIDTITTTTQPKVKINSKLRQQSLQQNHQQNQPSTKHLPNVHFTNPILNQTRHQINEQEQKIAELCENGQIEECIIVRSTNASTIPSFFQSPLLRAVHSLINSLKRHLTITTSRRAPTLIQQQPTQQQREHNQHQNNTPFQAENSTLTTTLEDIAHSTNELFYQPLPGSVDYNKKMILPFFLSKPSYSMTKTTTTMPFITAQTTTYQYLSQFMLPQQYYASLLSFFQSTPPIYLSFKSIQRQLLVHSKVQQLSFSNFIKALPKHKSGTMQPPQRFNATLLSLASILPLTHNNFHQHEQEQIHQHLEQHLSKSQHLDEINELTTSGTKFNPNHPTNNTIMGKFQQQSHITNITQLTNSRLPITKHQQQQPLKSEEGFLTAAIHSLQHLADVLTTTIKVQQQNQQIGDVAATTNFHQNNNNNVQHLRQQLQSQIHSSPLYSLLSTQQPQQHNKKSFTSQLTQLTGNKNKKLRKAVRFRVKQFYNQTFATMSTKSHLLTKNTLSTINIPLKPEKSLLNYPIVQRFFTTVVRRQQQKQQRNNNRNNNNNNNQVSLDNNKTSLQQQQQQRAQIHSSSKVKSKQIKKSFKPLTDEELKQYVPIKPISSSQLHNSTLSTSSKSKSSQTTTIHTQQQRSISFFQPPRTEKLSNTHFSTHTESTPFRYHVTDSLRAVTKFAYLRLSTPQSRLKVTKIRPVLMPFWGFQGTLTITHKPSQTKKVIDYQDVDRNLDTNIYCSLLNVREDKLTYGVASQHLVNPNCSYGQDFVHKATDMVGRKAEIYANQPHLVNTLRMRAQQIFSGSEWAPWQMEPLKCHLHLAQDYKPEFLEFPHDSLFPDKFQDYERDYTQKSSSNQPQSLFDDQLELPIEHAQQLRDTVSPLGQTYEQTAQLERLFPYIAASTLAIPRKQKNIPLETDEPIRSERACLIESLVNMVTLEYNLIQRGIGVSINQQHLSSDKIDELNDKYGHHLPDRDPMNNTNNNTQNPQDLKSIYDGAFLTIPEQREMLHELAKAHHTMKGTKPTAEQQPNNNNNNNNNNNDDTLYNFAATNPLSLPKYQESNWSLFTGHKYFKAIVPQQNKKQQQELDPIRFLQSRLLHEELDLTYNDDSSNGQKTQTRKAHKQFRSKLRQEIINSVLGSSSTTLSQSNRELTFDIPGTDYSVTFNNVTSRKMMYPGYIHQYEYLGTNTIVSSGVTGVCAGIPHRHYSSVIKNAIKSTIGAGFGAASMKFLLRRLVFPPIYTAAATIMFILYSLREVVAGHFNYSVQKFNYTKALNKEQTIESQIYNRVAQQKAAAAKQKTYEVPTADIIRDSWEFHPYNGFYTTNNWKAQNIWNAINQLDDTPEKRAARAQRIKDQKYEETKRKVEEMEKMRNFPPVIPTDPYLLILGHEFFGLDPKSTKEHKIKLSQVSSIPFQTVQKAYLQQIKAWHPDMIDQKIAYSPEYATERTRCIIEAWSKINNKAKKDAFDRQTYR